MKTRMKPLLVAALLPLLLGLGGCALNLVSGMTPDLALTLGRWDSMGTTAVKGGVGGSLALPVTVSDLTGKAVSGSYTVSFYLSSDATLDTAADTNLGDVTVSAGSAQTVSLTLPGTVAAGSYYLFGVLAAGGAEDAAANNNTVSIAVTIGANAAALGLSLKLPDSTVPPEGAFTASYRITNSGYAPIAAGTVVGIAFTGSVGGAVGTASVTLSEVLYPDAYVTGSAPLAAPSIAAMGYTADTFTGTTVTLTATATSSDGLSASQTATLTVPALTASLSIASITLPSAVTGVKPGGAMKAAVTIRNTGYAVSSANYRVILLADDGDSAYTSADTTLCDWTTTPAVPFDPVNAHNTVILTVPDGTAYPSSLTAPGTCHLMAVLIDGTEVVDTSSVVDIPCVGTLADLTLARMTTTRGAAIPTSGGTIPLTLYITNTGTEDAATPFVVHFYACAALTLTATYDLGTSTVSTAIPAGKTVVVSATATVPAASAGFYTLYWALDSTSVYAEANETDNTVTIANSCFVHFPVSSGSGTVSAKLIGAIPQDAPSSYSYLSTYSYSVLSGTWTYMSNTAGSATFAGDIFLISTVSLTAGTTYGTRFNSGYNVPYAFRFVPSYVTAVPLASLPVSLGSNMKDAYEPNDTQATATVLSGSANPVLNWTNAYIDSDEYDYFSFTMP